MSYLLYKLHGVTESSEGRGNVLVESKFASQIVDHAEQFAGDHGIPECELETEAGEKKLKEHLWTLCIDKANDLGLKGEEATAEAQEAMRRMGYT